MKKIYAFNRVLKQIFMGVLKNPPQFIKAKDI